MATADFYPDANPETSSVDGYANATSLGTAWATIRGAAGSGADASLTVMSVSATYAFSVAADKWAILQRCILLFDTSTLPAGAVITGATLKVRCQSKTNENSWGDAEAGVGVVSSSPASDTALVAGDYDSIGALRFAADKAYGDFTAGVDTTFTLNADGLAAIDPVGITKFALAFVADLDNTDPAHSLSASTYIVFYTADNGSNVPTLEITYGIPQTFDVDITALNVTTKTLELSLANTFNVIPAMLMVSPKTLTLTGPIEPVTQCIRDPKISVPKLSFELWNPAETKKYRPIESEIEELVFGNLETVGHADLSFTVKRNPRKHYSDLQPLNIIVVRCGRKVAWKGAIIAPSQEVGDSPSMKVDADGLGYRLAAIMGSAAVGAEKMSTWINAHLITDANLDYTSGAIGTSDFAFPYGLEIDYYAQMLENGNKANGYIYGVDSTGFFWGPAPTTPAYEVRAEDAKYSLNYDIEGIQTALYVTYTDGATGLDHSFWWPSTDPANPEAGTYDPTSATVAAWIALYGRRDGKMSVPGDSNLAQAIQVATLAIDELKRMRPKTSFVVTKVRDMVKGRTVPLPLVREGRLTHIRDLYPGRLTPAEAQVVNELSTLRNVQTSYDMQKGELTLSPGTSGLRLDILLAQLEANKQDK